jgi:hypothetical protein
MLRSLNSLTFAILMGAVLAIPSPAQDNTNEDHNLDIRSSVGDLHMGADADAKKVGLPLYPGARIKSKDDKDEDHSQANLSIFTGFFGMKLVVASYDSDDAPDRIVDFYRNKLKKYGKVIECHSDKHGGDVNVHADDKDSKGNKQLTCESNAGPVTELKVGTEDDQHVVAIEPRDAGKGSTFALVYVHTRGKQGEI